MNGIGYGPYPMVGFDISDVGPMSSATIMSSSI